MNIRYYILIMALMICHLCGCSSHDCVVATNNYQRYYYRGDESTNSKIRINLNDNSFEYYWSFWDGRKYGMGHWFKCDNQLILVFDVMPSLERSLEGSQCFGDTIHFIYLKNKLVQTRYVDATGYTNSKEFIFNEITKNEYDQLPF